MSDEILPSFDGLGWSITRAVVWSTRKQQNVSGKETSIAEWAFPRYSWQLVYNVLRQATINNHVYAEMASLMGFYNLRKGADDSFLYLDALDNEITHPQYLGMGDGVTTAFQLLRQRGEAVPQPIYAPNLGLAYTVYLAGAPQVSGFTITEWETTDPAGPGKIVFAVPPTNVQSVAAKFHYYWPCKFIHDQCVFEKLMSGYYRLQRLAFTNRK